MKAIIASCILFAAQHYSLPPQVLSAIHETEGGQTGMARGPYENGTSDLGPMQINTLWLDVIAAKSNMEKPEIRHKLVNDGCYNTYIAAYILKRHVNRSGSLYEAIAWYHSRTPEHGFNYRQRVLEHMNNDGLLDMAAQGDDGGK